MNLITFFFLLKLTLSYPFSTTTNFNTSTALLNATSSFIVDDNLVDNTVEILDIFTALNMEGIENFGNYIHYYIEALEDYESYPNAFPDEYESISKIQVGVINGLHQEVSHHKNGDDHLDFYYNLFCIIFPSDEMDATFLQDRRDYIKQKLQSSKDESHWGDIENNIRDDIKIMLGLQKPNGFVLEHDEFKKRSKEIELLIMEDFWYLARSMFTTYQTLDYSPPLLLIDTDYITPTSSYTYAIQVDATRPPQSYTEETATDWNDNNDGTASSLVNYQNLIDKNFIFTDIDSLYDYFDIKRLGHHKCPSYVYGLETGIDGTVANILLLMNRFYKEFNDRELFAEDCFEADYLYPKERFGRGVTANRYNQKEDARVTYQNDEQICNSLRINGLTEDEAIQYTRVAYVLKGQNQKQGQDLAGRLRGLVRKGGGTYDLNINYSRKIPLRNNDSDQSRTEVFFDSDTTGAAECLCVFVLLEQDLQKMDLKSNAQIAIKG